MATYRVGPDGKAPSYAKPGDTIVTGGGTYRVDSGTSGNYKSTKVSDESTYTYKGSYSSAPSREPSPRGSSDEDSSGTTASTYKYKNYFDDPVTALHQENVDRIAGIAKANDVDMGVAADMFRSNMTGKTNYPGGGPISTSDRLAIDAAYSQAEQARRNMRRSGDNSYDDYDNSLPDQYADMNDKLEKASRLAIQQAIKRLEASRTGINQGYDDTARQAYILFQQQQRSIPQLLAAQGIRGGGTEEAYLSLNASYGENINANERARQNALLNLDQSIIDIQNTGDLNLAQQQVDLQRQQMQDYRELLNAKTTQDNWAKQFASDQKQRDMENYLTTAGAYSKNYQAEINRLKAQGVSDNDYRILILNMMRNQKIEEQQRAKDMALYYGY